MKILATAFALLFLFPLLGYGQTNVSGSLAANTEWYLSGSPYVVTGNINVNSGFTLTIDSGVVVRFRANQALVIQGALWAHQTLFTSDKDTVGGIPAAGDWYGIVVGDWGTAGHIILDTCKVHYGGSGYADIYIVRGTAVLNAGEIANSPTFGLSLEQDGYFTVNNVAIYSNNWPIGYRGAGSVVFNGANALTGNTHNAIQMGFNNDPIPMTLDTAVVPFVFPGNFWIQPGGSLTVAPTDMLKFNSGTHLYVQGTLVANAPDGEKIVFTADTDDNVGGDSNADGTATVPASGYWGGVVFEDQSVDAACVMRRCEVTFAGNGNTGGISMYNASPTIDNCNLATNFYGVMMQDVSNPVFSNNTIGSSELVPIAMSFTANPAMINNTLSFSDNHYDAIGLLGSSTPSNGELPIRTVTSIPNITYLLLQTITVPAGNTFTIDKGVVIKALNDSHYISYPPRIVIQGRLIANGTPDSMIVFTSARDDIFGHPGDSNRDGTQTSPAIGDWGGITFEGTSDSTSILNYCSINYGSLPYDAYYNTRYIPGGAVAMVNASPTISNCEIKNVVYGIYAFQSSNPKISNTGITNSQYTPIAMSVSANPSMTGLTFTNTVWTALGIIGEKLGASGEISQRNVGGYPNITYILLEDLTINSGTNVTVDPGVVIKSNSAGIFVNGGFRAKGTLTGGNIIFTSVKDDNYGHPNDSNGDGNGTSAAPGDWKTIRFQATSDDAFSLLDSCTIKFGGADAYDATNSYWTNWGSVTFTDANTHISDCLITDAYNFGVRCEGSALPVVDNIEMRNCRRDPIAMSLKSNPIFANITFTSNASKGIRILEGTLSSNATLVKRDVAGITNIAYIVDQLTISPNAVLTIEPGVVIKFPADASCHSDGITVQGALVADATATQKIIFTSLQDDSNGGDTNNDGNSSTPARGDWSSIVFENSAADSLNVMRNCEVRYGGSVACDYLNIKAFGEIRIFDAAVVVDSCIVQQSLTSGIGVYGSANPDIRNSQIYNITETPITMSMFSKPTFDNNTALNVGHMALGIVPETYTVDDTIPIRDFAGYSNITYYLYAIQYYTIIRQVVNSGTTITVPAGVVFKGGLGILVNGKLNIMGRPGSPEITPAPVVFTDGADDTYGNPGDTNGDGSGSQPVVSAFPRLIFADISDDSSAVRFAIFRYADVGVALQQASPAIFGCHFDHDNWGVELNGVSNPAVDGCVFNNLSYAPLHTSLVSYPRSTDNDHIAGTTFRGIGVLDETLVQDVILPRRSFAGITNIPYVFGNYAIGTGAILTVEPGVILKFATGTKLTVNKGLIAEGGATPDSTIVFTDLRDDFYGGDTNADSSLTEPCNLCYWSNTGDWYGIVFNDESLDPLCRLKHCVIRDAGDYYYAGGGITTNNASPTITYCSINNNKYGIVANGASDPLVNNCDIYQNSVMGINNVNQSFLINAQNNWWGNNSGPTHSGNPGGAGDAVSDSVDYSPFGATGTQEPMAGDVSMNGSVQAFDASLILKYVVDPAGNPFSASQLTVGDVSGEMGVTAYDASLILQYVVGGIQFFPVQSSAKQVPFVAPKLAVSSIVIGSETASRGTSVVVPIRVKELHNLASVDVRIAFDDKLLTPREVKSASSMSGMSILTKFSKGEISVAIAGAQYLDVDGDMLYLTFDVAGDVRGTIQSSVACSRLLFNEKDFTSSTTSGEITVVGKPTDFALEQNYPNPFNPTTTIRYQIPEDGIHVQLAIFNTVGELVRSVVDADQSSGVYEISWDGRTNAGVEASSGIYFYRLTGTGSKTFTSVHKMLLMK